MSEGGREKISFPCLSRLEILARDLSPFLKEEGECKNWLLPLLEFYSILPTMAGYARRA
jgi:hypothetical protein